MGEFPGATGNSFQGIAKRTATRLENGECKMDVLDPALGNGNVTPTMQGINWVPIKAATNNAFSCAAIQWIVDNKAYNEEFVSARTPSSPGIAATPRTPTPRCSSSWTRKTPTTASS